MGYFEAKRGLALALSLVGAAIAGAIVPIMTTLLEEQYGWRGAFVGLSAFPLLVALPTALAMFRDIRFEPARALQAQPNSKIAGGQDRSRILRSRQFWQLILAGVCVMAATGGLALHLIPILTDKGFTAREAASVFICLGIGSITGRLTGGFVLDHLRAQFVAAAAIALPFMSCLLFLSGIQGDWVGYAGGALLGLGVGAETDCLAYLSGRFFGLKNFGFVWASMCASIGLGAGLGPWAGSVLFDINQNYELFQILVLAALGFAVLMLLTLGRYQVKEIEPVGALAVTID
jgi:predicted MFS family arabinose efflux permease